MKALVIRKKRKWLPFIIGFGFLVVFALAAFFSGLLGGSGSGQKSDFKVNSNVDVGKLKCPFDGAALNALPKHSPIAVIIDNLPAARPQSGLKNADLVLETLAEGGVTRLLAVYYHGEASSVGPIRSARPYFIELAGSFQAVLVHAGGSPEALKTMKSADFPHLNEFNHSGYFWRLRDRRAPHNLYSSTDSIYNLAAEVGLNDQDEVTGFTFKDPKAVEVPEDDGLVSNEVKIHFPKQYDVTYSYVPEEQFYRRSIAGEPHVDALTNTQLSPRNIIVKFVKTKVIDSQGRLQMEINGHGRALVFTGGNVIEAVWQKSAVGNSSIYKTMDGEIVELSPGQTWIEVLPETTKVTF